MTFVQLLLAVVLPAAVKILTGLGFVIMTFKGVDVVTSGLVDAAQTHWGGLPSAVLGLASMAGIPQALGLILGAFNARVALWVASAAKRLILK